MTQEQDNWVSLEFLGGPLDGAFRPVQAGVERFLLASGGVIHAYLMDEVHEGPKVRRVMRHHEIYNCSEWST